MNSSRLLRKLLLGLIAVGLAYFVMERWQPAPVDQPVASFCSAVVVGSPVQQLLADAASQELSTMLSEQLLRVYNTHAEDLDECYVSHRDGIVSSQQLVSRR